MTFWEKCEENVPCRLYICKCQNLSQSDQDYQKNKQQWCSKNL